MNQYESAKHSNSIVENEPARRHGRMITIFASGAALAASFSGLAACGGESNSSTHVSAELANNPETAPLEIDVPIGNINTANVESGEAFYTDIRKSGEKITIPHLRPDTDTSAYMSALLANMAWGLTQNTPESIQVFTHMYGASGMFDSVHKNLLTKDRQVEYENYPDDLQVVFFDSEDEKAIFTKYGDPNDPNSLPAINPDGRETIELTSGKLFMQTVSGPDGHSKWQKPTDPEMIYTYNITKLVVTLDPQTKELFLLEWDYDQVDFANAN